MIRKSGNERRGEDPALDISSLIDVGFLLLIYFLVTSTLDPREGDLIATMPGKATTSLPEPTGDIPRIVVDASGIVSMESEVLETNPDARTLVHLDDRLRTWREAWSITTDESPVVEIDVDDGVPGQRFVDVMNCLAGTGIERIVFTGDEW